MSNDPLDTIMTSRLRIAFKALFQLGLEPLALYALYKFGLWTGHYRRLESRAIENTEQFKILHPLFELPEREEVLKTLGADGEAALLKEADEIVDGRARLFGGAPVPLRLTLDGPLQHWTEYERGRAPIPFSGYLVRDLKFIWEPARFGWAFTLGRAYHVSGEAKYAEAFWKYFEEFAEGNPAYLGPHWMNGQEAAIRLMALVWAAQVFQTAEASTLERRARPPSIHRAARGTHSSNPRLCPFPK